MLNTLIEFAYILNRYVHIVCTTLIVGGTLFYELIVPVAIGELKHEQQLAVFGRARWSFKSVMWTCAVLMIISGAVSSFRLWEEYREGERMARLTSQSAGGSVAADIHRPGWWWAGHVSTGLVALLLVVSLMSVRRPPDYPLHWMRLCLTVLLVVIFFATVARHMRMSTREGAQAQRTQQGSE
jgi:hypothetical protein